MEAEEQDPLEGMGNAQIAEIYHRMKPEDQRLFRQFKRFHKRYYETHGHDAPKPPAGLAASFNRCSPGYHLPMLRPLPRRGPNCWPRNDSRSCASSWDWQSQLSCRHILHHRRPLSPATTSTSTFLVKAGQGEGGSSTTTVIEEVETKPDVKPRRWPPRI